MTENSPEFLKDGTITIKPPVLQNELGTKKKTEIAFVGVLLRCKFHLQKRLRELVSNYVCSENWQSVFKMLLEF